MLIVFARRWGQELYDQIRSAIYAFPFNDRLSCFANEDDIWLKGVLAIQVDI